MNRCVVIGGTHHNTLSMVRSLGIRGVEVDVILEDRHNKESYVLASKYISTSFVVSDGNEAVSVLRENYPKDQPVIICSDDVASLLDRNTAYYMDKQVQVGLAKKIGFDVPKSLVLVVGKDSPAAPCYPCIVKPLESIHGGKRFAVCSNNDELEKVLSSYEANDLVQLQEFIKRDDEIVVDGVSANGEIIIPGYVLKHRDHLGGTTFSTTNPISKLPHHISDKIRKMISTIGYKGLFGVELVISKDKYYFVEINLRNDATTYALTIAGVNLPFIWFLAQQGLNYMSEIREVKKIDAIVENRDINFMFKCKVSPWKWLSQCINSECKYFYDRKDMDPYRIARRDYLSFLVRKLKR